ncbi:uncharacterized protein [Onthophagus taurus]|uniref:uncharacterized protein n=1 Tax=Onthophagus taurus TaxID=166361 RepID=UPI0039BECDEF
MFKKIVIIFWIQLIKSFLCKDGIGEITIFNSGSYPNLTMHCINKNPESESALIWINDQMGEEILSDGILPKKYIWKMDEFKGTFFQDVKLQSSLDFAFNYTGFVLDKRWNDFKEIQTEGHEFQELTSISPYSDVFTIDFSLRIKEDGYVYISDHVDPLKARNTYFIIFGGWWNNSVGFRRCGPKEISESVYYFPTGECFNVKVFGKAGKSPTVSIKYWNHFRIEKQLDTINVYQYVDHTLKLLLTFKDKNNFVPVKAVIRTKTLGYWKFHDYKFYAITKSRIKSKAFFVSSERLCVKVYFKACPKCKINLEIWNDTHKIVSKEATQEGINWETIILKSEQNVKYVSLKLVIVADIKNELEPYLIGDIVDCSQDKTHQIQTNQIDKMLHTCCHSIKHAIKVCPRYSLWCESTNITSIDAYKSCPEKSFQNNCFSCDAFNNCKFCDMCCEKSILGDLECKCYNEDYSKEKKYQSDTWNELDILQFVQQNVSLDIFFTVSCNHCKGPITVGINITCISPWCLQLPTDQQHHTIEKNYESTSVNDEKVTFKVIGLTNYKIKIEAKRYRAKTHHKEYTLTTNATSSGPILDANIYEKTNSSLSIRFKPPYPKMGVLDWYKIYIKQLDENDPLEYRKFSPAQCKIWVDYHCVHLNKLKENMKYIMHVIPINNRHLFGASTIIEGFTKEDKPEPPEYLLLTWQTNHLNVEFPHPTITNGPLKSFTIFIDNEMMLKSIINNVEKFYKLRILKWKPAANITIGVKVENQGGQSNIVQNSTFSPPSIPQINTTAIEIKPNTSKIQLNLPGIEVNEHVECFLAVIVTKRSEEYQFNPNLFVLEDQKILEEVEVPQNYMSWVAWKSNITKNEPKVISIGDDIGNNRVLLEKTKYNITVYIKNTYNKKTNVFIWRKEVLTYFNDYSCVPCEACVNVF